MQTTKGVVHQWHMTRSDDNDDRIGSIESKSDTLWTTHHLIDIVVLSDAWALPFACCTSIERHWSDLWISWSISADDEHAGLESNVWWTNRWAVYLLNECSCIQHVEIIAIVDHSSPSCTVLLVESHLSDVVVSRINESKLLVKNWKSTTPFTMRSGHIVPCVSDRIALDTITSWFLWSTNMTKWSWERRSNANEQCEQDDRDTHVDDGRWHKLDVPINWLSRNEPWNRQSKWSQRFQLVSVSGSISWRISSRIWFAWFASIQDSIARQTCHDDMSPPCHGMT